MPILFLNQSDSFKFNCEYNYIVKNKENVHLFFIRNLIIEQKSLTLTLFWGLQIDDSAGQGLILYSHIRDNACT